MNYFGDFGPANFWSNIKPDQIEADLSFIKRETFDTIILLIPYSSFKPNLDDFESENRATLDRIFETAKKLKLNVVFRLGYLWDTNFLAERTFERYVDIYSCFKKHKKSKYESDFIEFARFFCDNFEIDNAFLSWEDFFWPVAHVEAKDCTDAVLESQTKTFVEYLLQKIDRNNLCVEQRTNRFFTKINHRGSLNYGYFNYLCNYHRWASLVSEGGVIENSLVVEKGFIEWLSVMIKAFELGGENKLIIGQFNIIDNSIDDDSDYHHHRKTVLDVCKLKTENAVSFFEFVSPLLRKYIHGLGFWSLWTVRNGHIYNGTFVHGAKGWVTNGFLQCEKYCLLLASGNYAETNLGYVRSDSRKKCFIFLEFEVHEPSILKVGFNGCEQILNLSQGDKSTAIEFNGSVNRNLRIESVKGKLSLFRIDFFNYHFRSILFDENKVPSPLWIKLKEVL